MTSSNGLPRLVPVLVQCKNCMSMKSSTSTAVLSLKVSTSFPLNEMRTPSKLPLSYVGRASRQYRTRETEKQSIKFKEEALLFCKEKKLLPRLMSGVTFHYISVITPMEIFIQGEVDYNPNAVVNQLYNQPRVGEGVQIDKLSRVSFC